VKAGNLYLFRFPCLSHCFWLLWVVDKTRWLVISSSCGWSLSFSVKMHAYCQINYKATHNSFQLKMAFLFFVVSVAGIWGLLALHLADESILPFDYHSYVEQLQVRIWSWMCKDGSKFLQNISCQLNKVDWMLSFCFSLIEMSCEVWLLIENVKKTIKWPRWTETCQQWWLLHFYLKPGDASFRFIMYLGRGIQVPWANYWTGTYLFML